MNLRVTNYVHTNKLSVDERYTKVLSVDTQPVGLEVVDTAGQEAYSAIRDKYLREGDGFLVVYSVADRESYEKVPELIKHIQKVRETQNVPCILLGNKADLDPDDRITEEEGQELAARFKIPFYETSAKGGQNIQESYIALVRLLRKNGPTAKPVTKNRGMSVLKRQGSESEMGHQRRGTAIGRLLKRIGNKKN
jgi:small GTP-binding protein